MLPRTNRNEDNSLDFPPNPTLARLPQCLLRLRFFDSGQCVRFVSGGVARVDKSDKVEAAGRVRSAMGKALAYVPDVGLSLGWLSSFEGSVARSLGYNRASL